MGGHAARLLAEQGHEVSATYRDGSRLEGLKALGTEAVKADVLDRAAIRRAVRRCEVVFHTAGLVGSNPAGCWSGREPHLLPAR